MSPSRSHSAPSGRTRSPARLVFWGALGAYALVRLRLIFRSNVNWDEFALLDRAVRSLQSGEVFGGGRPGLGTLSVLPFATECVNAVDALVEARILWTGIVAVSLIAFWLLLRGMLPRSEHRWTAMALGFGIWAMTPIFLRSSTQVRTDQPAILMGLLGGLALFASRERSSRALLGGMLLGIGFLFSQKLVYVAALVVLMVAGRQWLDRDWRMRRDLTRGALLAGGFLLVLGGYRALADQLFGSAEVLPLQGGLRSLAFYREMVGWRQYGNLLGLLVPQLLPLLCLPILTLAWFRDRTVAGRQVGLAWAVVALGLAVALFHAGRFPYFLMTQGLFLGVVAALVAGPILERIQRPVVRVAFLTSLWLPLALTNLVALPVLLPDTQAHQREILNFVERSLPADARGFSATGEFACRRDPDPFPVRFAQHVWAEFHVGDGEAAGRQLVDQFRDRQVSFMLDPEDRAFYPAEVREFWSANYVPYLGELLVAGREVEGGPGWRGRFEAVFPASYVWRAHEGSGAPTADVPLIVGERTLLPGDTIRLAPQDGSHELRLPEGGRGMLVLALDERARVGIPPFYIGF